MNAGTITVTLKALTDSFNKAVGDAAKEMEGWEARTSAAVKGAAAAFAGLTVSLGYALKEAAEAESNMVRAGVAFSAAGNSFDSARAEEFAGAMAKVTTYSDDAIISAQSLLASFKLSQGQTEQLIPSLANLASLYGGDVSQMAMLVGRSIQSGTNAMQRQGVVMTEHEQKLFAAATETQRLAIMMELLDGKAAGASEALANTTEGALLQAKNSFGELAETIGDLIKGPIGDLARDATAVMNNITDLIKRMTPEMKAILGKIMLVATALAGLATLFTGLAAVLPTVTVAFGMFKGVILAIIPTMTTLFTVLLPVAAILAAIVTSVGLVKKIGEMGGIEVLLGRREQTASEQQASADFREQSGGSFFGTIGAGFKEGLSSMTEGIGDLVNSALPPFDSSMRELETKARRVGSAFDGIKLDKDTIDFSSAEDLFTLDVDTIQGKIDRAAKESSLEYVGSLKESMLIAADGSTTALGKAFNFVADTMGADFANELGDTLNDIGRGIKDGLAVAGSVLVSTLKDKVGEIGKVIGAAAQGFQAGGFVGAIVAVIATLLSMAEAFEDIRATLDEGVFRIVGALNPLLQGLFPIIRIISFVLKFVAQLLMQLTKAIGPLIMVIGNMLLPIFKALDPVFHGLFYVVSGVALLIAYVAKGIGMLWNGILSAIAYVFNKLANIEIDLPGLSPIHPFGFMGDWADSVEDGKMSMSGLNKSIEDIKNGYYDNNFPEIIDAQENAADGLGDFAAAAEKATESLTNVPTGYKIALARFNAEQGGLTPTLSSVRGSGGSTSTASLSIGNITVQTDNPKEFWAEMKRAMEEDQFFSSGSPILRDSSYSGRRA